MSRRKGQRNAGKAFERFADDIYRKVTEGEPPIDKA